jgi:hypothetical protein
MSNAVQIRDASDITKYKKDRLIYQNYVQLNAKVQLPIGGIPHEHLMAIARANDSFIPTSSLIQTVTARTSSGPNTVLYAVGQTIADKCNNCTPGGNYMVETYSDKF